MTRLALPKAAGRSSWFSSRLESLSTFNTSSKFSDIEGEALFLYGLDQGFPISGKKINLTVGSEISSALNKFPQLITFKNDN